MVRPSQELVAQTYALVKSNWLETVDGFLRAYKFYFLDGPQVSHFAVKSTS